MTMTASSDSALVATAGEAAGEAPVALDPDPTSAWLEDADDELLPPAVDDAEFCACAHPASANNPASATTTIALFIRIPSLSRLAYLYQLVGAAAHAERLGRLEHMHAVAALHALDKVGAVVFARVHAESSSEL